MRTFLTQEYVGAEISRSPLCVFVLGDEPHQHHGVLVVDDIAMDQRGQSRTSYHQGQYNAVTAIYKISYY